MMGLGMLMGQFGEKGFEALAVGCGSDDGDEARSFYLVFNLVLFVYGKAAQFSPSLMSVCLVSSSRAGEISTT